MAVAELLETRIDIKRNGNAPARVTLLCFKKNTLLTFLSLALSVNMFKGFLYSYKKTKKINHYLLFQLRRKNKTKTTKSNKSISVTTCNYDRKKFLIVQ